MNNSQKKNEKIAIIGNAVLFQVLWFSAVFGAKGTLLWPAVICLMALLGWGFLFAKQIKPDLRLALVGVLIAFAVEPIWIGQELVIYPLQPDAFYPPAWIVILWVGFAVSFNHSLKWLRHRYLLGALLGGVGSVCSITAALRLEVITVPQGWFAFVIQYGAVWATIVPLLIWYAAKTATELSSDVSGDHEGPPDIPKKPCPANDKPTIITKYR